MSSLFSPHPFNPCHPFMHPTRPPFNPLSLLLASHPSFPQLLASPLLLTPSLCPKPAGESEQKLREAFEAAEATARSGRAAVIFLDEVDALCPRRDAQHQHEARVVAQLLTLMDGASTQEGSAHTPAVRCHKWMSQMEVTNGCHKWMSPMHARAHSCSTCQTFQRSLSEHPCKVC